VKLPIGAELGKIEEDVKPVETKKQQSKTMKKSQPLKMNKPQVVKKKTKAEDVDTITPCDVNVARKPPPKFEIKLAPKLFPIFNRKLKPAGDSKTGFDMPATLPDFNFTAQVCTEGTESEDSPANERPGHSWQREPGRNEEFWQAGIGRPGEEPGQPGQ
jgi:hypothetical protein